MVPKRSTPLTTKYSFGVSNDRFNVASSCMQGWRRTMEDYNIQLLSLPGDHDASLFGVFDGHGGSEVAKYVGKHIHKFILRRPEYMLNKEEALRHAFLEIDNHMLKRYSFGKRLVGSTGIVTLIKNNRLYCANVGDSRAVACVNGLPVALSVDHKPYMSKELTRINNAGGWVTSNRVNGKLSLSRAFGDFALKRVKYKGPKEQIITAYPDIQVQAINKAWEFVILACDGIWDVMTSADVIEFCRTRIGYGMQPKDICEELMNNCLSTTGTNGGGTDNMTVVMVCFLHGKSYKDLIERCLVKFTDDILIFPQPPNTANDTPTFSGNARN